VAYDACVSRRNVTIKDVARLAGVSISTASRALSGAGGVSRTLVLKVESAADKLDYRPNAAARGLRKARTATLGIIFNNLRGPGQLDLLKGIGSACNQAGFLLLSADADGDHAAYLQLIHRFFEQRIEGLFLVSPIGLGDALADFSRYRVPAVTLLRRDASAGTAPIVAASEKRGIHDAIHGLARLGHKNIMYLFRYWDESRVSAVLDALAESSLEPSTASRVFEDDPTPQTLKETLEAVLAAPDKPSALVVHSAFVGPVTEVADAMKLRLGSDLSLVSIGTSSWQGSMVPNLAAVEADNQSLGTLACNVMLDWIKGIEPKPAYSELARWIQRGSVGPAPSLA
jgi:DNA-binding LacI/PurR family transcriptional regulator